MYKRDYRDILGGGLLLSAGILIVVHALGNMPFGTLQRMGPGFFPTSLGAILSVLGLAIAVSGLFRAGTLDKVEWRPAIAVLAAIVFFAVAVRPLGLAPAIIGMVLIGSLAEKVFRPVPLLALVVILPLVAYLIFSVGLGLPLVMYRMPF